MIKPTLILALLLTLMLSTAYGQDFEATKKAAENGDAIAQVNLGLMYNTGEKDYGVPKNDAEALKWFRLAAEQGYAQGQNDLGNMYREGEGVPKNDAEAAKWYKLAAEQGHAGAQNHLGFYYYTGEGIPKNDAEAVKWYKLAVEQGHAHAQFNLGVMYANGEGVPENAVKAYVWYSLAAANGFNAAPESRDMIKTELSQEQLAKAQEKASRCVESQYKDCN